MTHLASTATAIALALTVPAAFSPAAAGPVDADDEYYVRAVAQEFYLLA